MSRTRWQALLFSLALHLAVVAAGVFSVSFSSPMAMPRQLAIEATVVDSSILDAMDDSKKEAELEVQRREREREELERRQAREAQEAVEEERRAEQARIEEERLAREAEQKRIADEQAAAARAEAEQQQKLREAERAAAERKEAERLAELRRKNEAEERRVAEERRQRAEAIARKQREEDARRQAEAEALLVAQLEEEERRLTASKSGLREQYALLIKQKIERNWNRPGSAEAGLECEVSVTQLPSLEVVDVRVGKCNGDAVTVDSIEKAVLKASPLPAPPDPSLFERKLTIIFRPDS
ncbi:MAG: cell envelope integrity protein TolA [Gammaproteobacteria bacterium]|nr:cell envelope integrity protein TolA [Gammaproteobacteria bacterium]